MEMKSGQLVDSYKLFVLNLIGADSAGQRVSEALIGESEAGTEDDRSHDMVAVNSSLLALQGKILRGKEKYSGLNLAISIVNHT